MKKYFIILFFTLIITSVYSAEAWLSAEYQYGFSFFKGEDIDSVSSPESKQFNIGHSGINIKTYTFWNSQNIGLFTKAGLRLPYFIRNDNENDYRKYGGIPLSLGTGLGFRHILSEKSNIHYAVGLGFDFFMFFSKYKLSYPLTTDVQEHTQKLDLSLLFDIGYKYNLNNNIYLNTGANLNFGFAKHIKKSSKSDLHNNSTSKWVKGFFSCEFMPYFGIGFIINSK